jgi:pimeloyl-ACP methyl ester carboxylesterase
MGFLDAITAQQNLRGTDIEQHPTSPLLNRRYVGAPGRQTHLLEAGPRSDHPPLWCLHATAYSGRSFTPFLEAMAANRHVVAPDTCGYGGSDGADEALDIQGYARRMGEALDGAGEKRVDLLGYHTGAIIAAELARMQPERVGRLVLIGVPYLSGAEQRAWRERLAAPMVLGETLAQFQERWDFLVAHRDPKVPLSRAFDNFVDELRAYPYGWRAHDAAFSFDVRGCFEHVLQPTLILNPDNHLSGPSRVAADVLPNAELVELPGLNNGIFDIAPERLAALTEAFLQDRTAVVGTRTTTDRRQA